MQSVYSSRTILQGAANDKAASAIVACLFLFASAGLAAFAPIAFSVATVFLFAGPHNWIELRYFLSRLPSRFGPMKGFFMSSFAGVIILGTSFAVLTTLMRFQSIGVDTAISSYQMWIAGFHVWLAVLIAGSGPSLRTRKIPFLLAVAISAVLGLNYPLWFGLALVYLHPLAGLAILERELRRSRPGFLGIYRACLLAVPAIVAVMIVQLSGTPSLALTGKIDQQITEHAGSFLLTTASSHLLVSVHTFLEMLHYGVWLLAIPLATNLRERAKWKPDNLLVAKNSPTLRSVIAVSLIASSVFAVVLWIAFMRDYSITRDVYFTVAIFHILAELPFLLWIL